MCTPSRRCVPEHSRHMSVPYVTDAHEREAATVAEEALVKQAEAAKMAQEAANARDEANKAAHRAAQWKADAQQAIKSTKEANLRTEHCPEPNMVTALATAQGSHG